MSCRTAMVMQAPPSIHDVVNIGELVSSAGDLAEAFKTAAAETSRVLQTSTSVFQKADRAWMPLAASAETGIGARPETRAALDRVARGGPPALFGSSDQDSWTAVALPARTGAPLAAVLGGNWTARTALLRTWTAVTALALETVRERAARGEAERLLLEGYSTARRLSRPANVESVCRRIVDHVARLLDAERVSLAVYRPAEDCLVVEAASGRDISELRDVRIQPGAWVIGHVFSTGRPVFVRDVRQLRGMIRDQHHQYRTYSFAAVPLFAGPRTVGVLTATDKKNGSPLTRRDLVLLRTYGAVAAMAIVAARSQDEMGRLAHAATVDSLTGLLNRPYLDARLHQEVERARRGANSLAVLMADVDDFKVINDTYGHQVGDAVLKAVGGILRSAVRVFDVCARYGGDEFAILMPNSDAASAAACGERIRRRLAGYRGEEHAHPLPPLTMSIGVAVIEPGDAPSDLIMRADKCLYEAKADGKNRVRVHPSVRSTRPTLRPGDDEQEP